jgi:hypothetical protein
LKIRINVSVRDENTNLFPKKRELEKKIEVLELEIVKGDRPTSFSWRHSFSTLSTNLGTSFLREPQEL